MRETKGEIGGGERERERERERYLTLQDIDINY